MSIESVSNLCDFLLFWAHACECMICIPLRLMSGSVAWHPEYFTYLRNVPSLQTVSHYSHCAYMGEEVWGWEGVTGEEVIGEKLSWFGAWLWCVSSFGIGDFCYCIWLGPLIWLSIISVRNKYCEWAGKDQVSVWEMGKYGLSHETIKLTSVSDEWRDDEAGGHLSAGWRFSTCSSLWIL